MWHNKDRFLVAELFYARAFVFLKLLSLAFILYSVAASFPKCLYRNRVKVTKNAEFSKIVGPFPVFYGGEWDTCICLVCPQQVSVMKQYNNRRHYETHHVERYRGLQGQPRREKVKELIAGLKKQQSVFTSSHDISAAAVKASCHIANDIVLASKPYSKSEFVKTCTLKAAEIVCSEKLKFLLKLV